MPAQIGHPPQRNVFSVVRQADGTIEERAGCGERFLLSCFEREIEERQGPTNRRVEYRRQNLVEIGVLTRQLGRHSIIAVRNVIQPRPDESPKAVEVAQDEPHHSYLARRQIQVAARRFIEKRVCDGGEPRQMIG